MSIVRTVYPRPVSTVLTTTNETVLYTAPNVQSAIAVVEYVRITNITAIAATVTVAYRDSSAATTYNQLFQWSLDGNDTLKLDLGFQFDPNDTLRVTAGTANALHATATIYESQGRGS